MELFQPLDVCRRNQHALSVPESKAHFLAKAAYRRVTNEAYEEKLRSDDHPSSPIRDRPNLRFYLPAECDAAAARSYVPACHRRIRRSTRRRCLRNPGQLSSSAPVASTALHTCSRPSPPTRQQFCMWQMRHSQPQSLVDCRCGLGRQHVGQMPFRESKTRPSSVFLFQKQLPKETRS